MNPSLVIIAVSVTLAGVLLLGGYLNQRRKASPDYFERTRSPRYDTLMRDHRRGFIWTACLAAALAALALVDWASLHFRSEWPTVQARSYEVQTSQAAVRQRYSRIVLYTVYMVTAHYTFTVNDQQYVEQMTYSYRDPASRDQRAASLSGGEVIPIWYHPIVPLLHFTSAVGPIYDVIILCVAGFVSIGTFSSLWGMLRLKMTDGY
ncbi:MAG: hypothetical protein U0694_17615 [Anaerolineae bacterium]